MTSPISQKSYINLESTNESQTKNSQQKGQLPIKATEVITDLKIQEKSFFKLAGNPQARKNSRVESSIQGVYDSKNKPSLKLEDSNSFLATPDSPKFLTKQTVNFSNESFEITNPSKEFYATFLNFQLSNLPKILKDPQKCYQAIESLFHTSLCINNGHFLQKLGEFIAQIPETQCTKGVIDKIFDTIKRDFIKTDPQCARNFGNALVAVLMNIAEREQSTSRTQLDMVREIGNSAEIAFKRILIEVILADGAAKSIYEPVLHPAFKVAFTILWFDHFRLVNLEKDPLKTKDQDPDQFSDEIKYKITPEGLDALKVFSGSYHAEIGTRPVETYRKIWPEGLKAAFCGFYGSLERIIPPNDNNNNVREIPIQLSEGKTINVPAWKIGTLALFGSMSIFSTIFHVWMEGLKISEKYLFDNQELLRESLKKLLFDPKFYFASLLQHKELKDVIFSTQEQHQKYLEENSTYWKTKLTEKLKDLSSKSQDNDEKELFTDVSQIIEKYQDKTLPSREFEKEFSARIDKFKIKRFYHRIRLLLNEESFINLIKILPEFKFHENEKKQADEITSLFNAIMENNPSLLSKLSDKKSAEKIKDFLSIWGVKLQSIIQKNAMTTVVKTLINWGFFKEKIANQLKKLFKIPVGIDELPTMLEGMQELPEKDLVDLFRGFMDSPDLKEGLKEEVIHQLLYDPASPLVDELEKFMLDENFSTAHFDILSTLYPSRKKTLEIARDSWNRFMKCITQLIQDKDFTVTFKKYWEENRMGFREQLTTIASNPAIYKSYDPLIIYVFFKNFKKKSNGTDKVLLFDKARAFIEMVYDIPTQTAAKKIKGGDSYQVDLPNQYDSYKKKLIKPLEVFGAEGKIKNHLGHEVYYHEALAQIDASFVDFEKVGKEKASPMLHTPPEKLRRASKQFLEKEIEDLMGFLPNFAKGKEKQEQRELWHFVLS